MTSAGRAGACAHMNTEARHPVPGVLAQGIRGHRHHVAAVTEILGDYYAAPGQPGHARTRRTPEGAVS